MTVSKQAWGQDKKFGDNAIFLDQDKKFWGSTTGLGEVQKVWAGQNISGQDKIFSAGQKVWAGQKVKKQRIARDERQKNNNKQT